MRTKCLLIILCGIGFALVSPPASAQKVTNGGLSGTLVSANVHLASFGSDTMLTTPSAGSHFILTYFCATAEASLEGSTFGLIFSSINLSFSVADHCQTFTPGIALPADEDLICTSHRSSEINCTISGVISKQ